MADVNWFNMCFSREKGLGIQKRQHAAGRTRGTGENDMVLLGERLKWAFQPQVSLAKLFNCVLELNEERLLAGLGNHLNVMNVSKMHINSYTATD